MEQDYLTKKLEQLAKENTAMIWWITRAEMLYLFARPHDDDVNIFDRSGDIIASGENLKEAICNAHKHYMEKGIY